MSVMFAKEVDIKNITITPPKTLDSGGKLMFLNYGGDILYIQSPEFELPFDCSWSEYNENNFPINVSFKDMDSNSGVNDFHKLMSNLDEHFKEEALKNRGPWLKMPKATKDGIESLYNPQIKLSKDRDTGEPDGKFPDRFQFKVQRKGGVLGCKVYDNKKADLLEGNDGSNLPDLLKKGSKVKALLKCNGIWVANGKFGCNWKAEQLCVKECEGLKGFAFRDDSSDDDDDDDSGEVVVSKA